MYAAFVEPEQLVTVPGPTSAENWPNIDHSDRDAQFCALVGVRQ